MRARANHCAVIGASGQMREAVRELELLHGAAESLGYPSGSGMAMINLIHGYWLQGQLAKTYSMIRTALAYVRDKPGSNIIGIVYSTAAFLALEGGDPELAVRLMAKRIVNMHHAIGPEDRGTLDMLRLLESSLAGAPVDPDLDQQIASFEALAQRNEGTVFWPAVLLRRAGRPHDANAYLDRMVAAEKLRIYDLPFVLVERSRIAMALGDEAAARNWLEQARAAFQSLGMPRRGRDEQALELGSANALSRPQKALLESLLLEEPGPPRPA
jgi:hypothetical protein